MTFHASRLYLDRPSLGMAAYLVGMHFNFTYQQAYGWAGLLSDFELYYGRPSGLKHNEAKKKNAREAFEMKEINSTQAVHSSSPMEIDSLLCLVPNPPCCISSVLSFSELWR
ncbi:unnamed protein product [Protopolystoma xenopodis]|uniref:Uncharacterized protein n=1 Tax=Protopolystoma xenopodis TaxID=117903 RepID=A0A448X714_9PLAT|nr:unnamed protein product [Protopolystoma xenopodis]